MTGGMAKRSFIWHGLLLREGWQTIIAQSEESNNAKQ